MDFLDILNQKAFLGREFLTWLWFKSLQQGGAVRAGKGKTVEIIFLDRMTLDLSDEDSPQTVSIKGELSGLREGLAALKEGKKIEEARISVRVGEEAFTTALKATWFAYGSFKVPPVLPASQSESEEDAEAAFLEKVYLIEEGVSAIDALFERFMDLRLSENWEREEVPAIKEWIIKQSP
jgi:recombination associated protein RdgC